MFLPAGSGNEALLARSSMTKEPEKAARKRRMACCIKPVELPIMLLLSALASTGYKQ